MYGFLTVNDIITNLISSYRCNDAHYDLLFAIKHIKETLCAGCRARGEWAIGYVNFSFLSVGAGGAAPVIAGVRGRRKCIVRDQAP